jgi:hypothetical protein
MGLVSLVVVAGCSFGIKTSTTPASQAGSVEPTCSESEVRPGFDGTMAVWSAATAALAGSDLSNHSCGDVDGYGYERGHSCAAYGVVIGGGIALAALFTAATVYGVTHANRCTRENDKYDEHAPAPVLAAMPPPMYASKDWPPELIAACQAERSAMLANATSAAVREQISEDMVCGPVAPRTIQPRPRKRYRGSSSSGIGSGFLVGSITLLIGAGIWADR